VAEGGSPTKAPFPTKEARQQPVMGTGRETKTGGAVPIGDLGRGVLTWRREPTIHDSTEDQGKGGEVDRQATAVKTNGRGVVHFKSGDTKEKRETNKP